MKKATLQEVAELAGVSIGTASRVMHKQNRIAPETRERVLVAAGRLGYSLPESKHRVVAVIAPSLEMRRLTDYFVMVFNALRGEIHDRGYQALLVSPEDIGVLNEWTVSGAISFDYLEQISSAFPKLKNIPLVCYNDKPNHWENVYAVYSNKRKIYGDVIRHLKSLGHTRIGICKNEDQQQLSMHLDTRTIFHGIMKEAGLEKGAFYQATSPRLPHFEALGMLLKHEITALIAVEFGPRTDRYLKLYGKRIPEDISLVAGGSLAAENMYPRHSAMDLNYDGMARAALDILETIWKGGKVTGDTVIDSIFTIRESTGPAPGTTLK